MDGPHDESALEERIRMLTPRDSSMPQGPSNSYSNPAIDGRLVIQKASKDSLRELPDERSSDRSR